MTPSLALATVLAVAAVLLSLWALGLRRRAAEARRGLVERERELAGERAVAARLAASEARFRELVEAADDVIFRTDAEGRFTYVNPAAEEVLGWRGGELLGRAFLDVVRPDYREQARRFYEDQRQQGIPNTYCEFPDADPRGRGPVGGPARAARQRGRPLRRPAGGRAQHHRAQARAAGDRARARAAAADRHPRAGGDGHARPRGPPPRAQHALAALPRGRRPVGRGPHARRGLAGDAGAATGGCSSGPSPARW